MFVNTEKQRSTSRALRNSLDLLKIVRCRAKVITHWFLVITLIGFYLAAENPVSPCSVNKDNRDYEQ